MDTGECAPGVHLLPPSPNWFICGAIDSREDDRLLVAAAFKTIVLFKIPIGVKAPEMLKSFVHGGNCKVLHVRLFPSVGNDKYKSSLLATGEFGSVTLYCCNSGKALLQHSLHKPQDPKQTGTLNGVCWSVHDNGDVFAVSVGARGSMVLWNLDTNLTVQHTITAGPQHQQTHKPGAGPPALTIVEPVPGGDGRVMVGADKAIHMVDVKQGIILSTFRGHDLPVYCLRWYRGSGSPLHATVDNPRASALLGAAGKAADASPSPDVPPPSLADQPSVSSESNTGRYFASSDMGRGIFVWDVEARRYVAKTSAATGPTAPRKGAPRNSRSMPQHAALAWSGSQLLTNNASGEILTLSFWSSSNSTSAMEVDRRSGDSAQEGEESVASSEESSLDTPIKSKRGGHNDYNSSSVSCNSSIKTVHREHSRVVYNLHIFDSLVVSVSQDRSILGYCLNTRKVCFNLPSLGTPPNSMCFCPHDASWLTLGMQDNTIKLVNLHSNPPYRNKTLYNTIKGKVLALSWHPKDEEILLFGTADGQVGFVDINSCKVTTFSYFHQKSVYKVEWAPPVGPEKISKLGQLMFAYSFGDRDIVMRNPMAVMEDPVKLRTILPSLPSDVCEFSFSLDFRFLAVGGQDGTIYVVKVDDLTVLVKMVVVRRSIQHLLWKPKVEAVAPLTDQPNDVDGSISLKQQYTLAVASSDSKICIMDLDKILLDQCNKLEESRMQNYSEPPPSEENTPEETTNDTSSNETNCVKKDYFKPLIVSSCTRELSGHAGRVVWLSYSPHQPHLLVSASYDHTCQVWDTATGAHLGNYRGHPTRVFRVEFSPNEAGLLYSFGEENTIHQWSVAALKHKSPPSKVNKLLESRPKQVTSDEVATREDHVTSAEAAHTAVKARPVPVSDISKRVAVHRSLFPLLHKASCHKRSFNLLAVLCMNEHNKLLTAIKEKEDERSIDDLLDGVDGDDNRSAAPAALPDSAVSHYSSVLAGVGQALLEHDLEAPPPVEDVQTLLDFYGSPTQLASFLHKQSDDHDANNRVSCGGTLHAWAGTIDQHVRAAMANSSLTADMVAQAPQVSYELWEEASAAYARQLAAAGEPLQAVTYLLNAKQVSEAVEVLLKSKLHREALVLAKARLPYNTELHQRVAAAFATAATYEGNFDLAAILYGSMGDFSTAASCLCRRGDTSSLAVAGLLYRASNHALAAPTLLQALRVAGAKGVLDKLPNLIRAAPELEWFGVIVATHRVLTAHIDALQLAASAPASIPSVNAANSSSQSPTFKFNEDESALDAVLRCWVSEGFSASQHQQLYDSLKEHLSTEQKPITLKQFWYLLSIEVSKMLLAVRVSSEDGAAVGHLLSALQLALDWGRQDAVHQVTHLLLPQGPGVVPAALSALTTPEEGQATPNSVKLLTQLYLLTECSVLVDSITKTHEQSACDIVKPNCTLAPMAASSDVPELASAPAAVSNSSPCQVAFGDEEREAARQIIEAVTLLLDTLSPDFSVLPNTSDCKIDMFLDPRSFLRQIVSYVRNEGLVEEAQVTRIVALLEKDSQ